VKLRNVKPGEQIGVALRLEAGANKVWLKMIDEKRSRVAKAYRTGLVNVYTVASALFEQAGLRAKTKSEQAALHAKATEMLDEIKGIKRMPEP